MPSTVHSPGPIVERVAGWLRHAYGDGIPAHDLIGVLCVLSGRLTVDERDAIAPVVADITREDCATPVDEIRGLLQMATPGDVAPVDRLRVAARLAGGGWPLGEVLTASD